MHELTEEVALLRANEEKLSKEYEERIRELEAELSHERTKRLEEFNLFEKKKHEMKVIYAVSFAVLPKP